ncbi:MAG: recombinase family protein [Ktedonobacteraceae bacterium]
MWCFTVSVSENIDNSLTGKLIRSVLAWAAESEREKINEYANRHWQKRRELGQPMATSTPPYGWQWGDKEKTFFELNIEEAAVRLSIFEMFVELDMSIRQIGHKLTLDGIPVPREARKEPLTEKEIEENGRPKLIPWNTGTIHMYLKDPANIGTLVICKKKKVLTGDGKSKRIDHPDMKLIPGGMPAIVSPEMFERAQRKLSTNRETKSQRPRDPENYLLIGHVTCAICGNHMHPICEKTTHVYRCNKHISILDANPHCEPHVLRIKASSLDQAVWHDCCLLFERLELIQSTLEAEIKNSISNLLEDTTGREQIAALKLAIEHARQEHAKQQDDYLRSLIAQDIQNKLEQLERFDEECQAAVNIAALTASYQQRVLEFVNFVNVMRGKYHEATFQEKHNALDVLGVRVYVQPSKLVVPIIQVESEEEWLTISDAARLTGFPRSSIQQSIAASGAKTERRSVDQIVFYRDAVREYHRTIGSRVDLDTYDDEWFTIHKLRTIKLATYPIVQRAMGLGLLPPQTRQVERTVIHRDELNRLLRESPIKSRSLFEEVSERIQITYSPLFVGTGVQASL